MRGFVSLFTIRALRPKKKGDPRSRARGLSGGVTKTGYCGFSTVGRVSSAHMDDHVRYLLDEAEKNLDLLQNIVRSQGLKWAIVCFYDSVCDELPSDTVSQRILERAEKYGILVVRDCGAQHILLKGVSSTSQE